jgi:hypothetical protein
MPVQYRFDSNIVVIETIGEYSVEEFRTTFLDSLNDSQRPTNSFLLIDLTQSVSIYNRSSEEIKTMARFVASQQDRFNNRIAMVGPNDLPYGMMRMGSAGSEARGIEAKVFRSFAEARKWLLC